MTESLHKPCKHWRRARSSGGYGSKWFAGKATGAHRVAWIETNGPIPEGMSVLHRCDNPPCIEVSHLYLGTAAENAHDRETRHRRTPARGSANGRTKVTPDQVASIRDERERSGTTLRELSIKHGVSISQVWRIVRKEHWSHV